MNITEENTMNKLITAAAVSAGILLSTPALASNVDVEITNLTNGLYFTPLLVAAHDYDTHLFQAGTDAVGTNVQAMAEGGDISGLIGEVEASGGVYVANPAEGLLAPGESTTATLKTRGRHNTHLSITAMLLPTNDGFVGLDGLMIPKKKGTYTYLIDAYDAGTEANDELIVGMPGGAPGMPGIPADPSGAGGSMGTGVAGADHNMKIHIHRGVIGDTDPVGGLSDLNRDVHRFNNPVAKVVVKVK
jgi:hypothetical protein